ncbi:Type 1 glutamine amidotransferase-like domain-containing protein [Alkaliflexus imshenetskii]|uniref:Type 1 glutamine amidotransferase-like domain-containing protein n=1 Tax=Alkaliflexus imshenetskii TaxID=286730 RepID=UPI00047AFBAF|nr:Type 1 glutamine amidotransferase-like domain-containing protein [Alkaliflexus imshenetskii]
MRKLFLSSSFKDVAALLADFANEDLNGKTVTFIPTASNMEAVTFYVGSARKAFIKLGMVVDELDVSKADFHLITEKLNRNNYIYVSGGNTFYLLQELKRTGADKEIINQIEKGKIYIGESAGSIVMAPDIEYVKMLDDSEKASNLETFSALNMVDFYPLPHFTNFPFKKTVERIIDKYHSLLKLSPISNSQVIFVEDDNVMVVNTPNV